MSRFTAWMNVALIATIVALLTPTTNQALAQVDDDQNTEDILYLADGRVLHGQIISETEDEVVFNIAVNRKANLFAKMTFSMADIESIERDVSFDAPGDQDVTKRKTRRSFSNSEDDTDKPAFGRFRASSDAEDVPSFYIIPMKGQMGTDIIASTYKELVPDIHKEDPAVIIIVMNCADFADTFAAALSPLDPSEITRPDFDEYKKLASVFHDDLKQYRQVVWVQDAVGISSTVALSWEELYMTPTARLGGMSMVLELTGADKHSDDDIRAKMMAAWMGSAKSLLEHGGYSYALADAMMWAPNMLSATFKGREVVWSLNKLGEFIIDSDDERTANFRAEAAENLLISDGTADTLDDLALLLGFREYRVVDEQGKKIVDGYRKNWRAAYSDVVNWWSDYLQYMGWATGEDTLRYLSKAKRTIERMIKAMDRYPTVAARWRQEYGTSKLQLELLVEQLKQQIRDMRQQRGGGGGAGGGGRRGAGGMGGG